MGAAVQEMTDFVVDVLDGMGGPAFPIDAVTAILCPRLDAAGGVLQRTTWATGETDVAGSGVTPAEVDLMVAATVRMRTRCPLMVAAASGDLRPATGQGTVGGAPGWRRSPVRAFLQDLRGWDQMVSLPLRGGPAEIAAVVFARQGRDFDERDLGLLAAVQPVLRALDRHVQLMGRWQNGVGPPGAAAVAGVRAAGLTGRELSVLLCLSEGLTAAATAHRLGCSVRTVSKHTANVYRKLDVHDRLTAVLAAQRLGMLGGPVLPSGHRAPRPPVRVCGD